LRWSLRDHLARVRRRATLTPTLTRTKGTDEFIRNAQLEDESFGWANLGGETPDG
jgi:hypothetical protein